MFKVIGLCTAVLLCLSACTPMHTQEKLTEIQQIVGFKNKVDISRWRNIQLNKQSSINLSLALPARLSAHSSVLSQSIYHACNTQFAYCTLANAVSENSHMRQQGGFTVAIDLQQRVIEKKNEHEEIIIEGYILDLLATVKDFHSQQIIEKYTVNFSKPFQPKPSYNLEQYLQPAFKQLFEDLSSD